MEFDFALLEDSAYEIGGDNETSGSENERCGICMDVIIDRGVLDCCQHWFCFGCIDNWASITNLCPLCQNEFQLITCVPVYDTIGGGKVEDDSLARDDDWCIQGTNNTLSFPSYYIDENAVICLDGTGCKIRNGLTTGGDDTILDTSIACDSCDLWYHAFCVEFDPESTSENSWLCPRCIDEVPQKSDGVSIQISNSQFSPETAGREQLVKASHSGNVSVSVADAGETAVVVSMIEDKHWNEGARGNGLQAQDIDQNNQTVDGKSSTQPYPDAEESLTLSLSQDNHFTSPCDTLHLSELETSFADATESEPNVPAKCAIFSGLLSDEPDIGSKPSCIESNVDLHLGLSVQSSLSADKMEWDTTERHKSKVSHSYKLYEDSPVSDARMSLNADDVGSSVVKRKSISSSDHDLMTGSTEMDDVSTGDQMVGGPPAKKAKGDGKYQQTHFEGEGRKSPSGSGEDSSHVPAGSKYEVDDLCAREETITEPSEKKVKGNGKSQPTCSKAKSRKSASGSGEDSSHLPAGSKYKVDDISARDEMVTEPSEKKAKGDGKSRQSHLKAKGRKCPSGSGEDSSHLPPGSKYEVDDICIRDEMVTESGSGKSQQTRLKTKGRKSPSGSREDSSHLPAGSKYEVDDICAIDDIVVEPSENKAEGDGKSLRTRSKDEGRKPISGSSQEGSHLPVGFKHAVNSKQTRDEVVAKVHANKAKVNEKSQQTHLKPNVKKSVSGSTQEYAPASKGSIDVKLRGVTEQENRTPDIMSIVSETNQRRDRVPRSNPADKSLTERDNGAKLRVKKIMRRAAEDESSKLVENLRKEIREAVRSKATNDFSKSNLFDPKLLIAFRNAIARPKPEHEPVKRLNPSDVRAKKLILQKGKVRENLTKKIYGNSNGRRKRAWDRDCEVEFWKHRCRRASKPEKVETLTSVLDLLRRSSDSSEIEYEPGEKAASPILSRLYLADTSVFPRKDDIKPLSALTGTGNDKVNDKHTSRTPLDISKTSTVYSKSEGCKKVYPEESVDKQNTSVLASGSKVNDQSVKEMPSKSDVKSDKRKWALEVLARKTSTIQRNPTEEKDEDAIMLKGKFPLLAQLPSDMRPVLAPCRHNKVPTSARQAQLYRLTEHFLRKADLPVMRRTADTELAVADAVNIEKDVVNRSNSKLVYLNLCSQVVSQHTNSNKHDSTSESEPSESVVHTGSMDPPPKEPCDLSAEAAPVVRTESTDPAPEEPYDLSTEAALRMAGLLSDSPPGSPCQTEVGNTDPSTNEDKSPENVFDIDTHAELDIYGDFEYDLGSEDYIGGIVPKVSKVQTEEGDSKMKVVFSSLSIQKTDDVMLPNKIDRLESADEPKDSVCQESHRDAESSLPPPETLHEEIDGEPSLAECEELYGPDKEPVVDISMGKDIIVETQGSKETATTSGFDGQSCEEGSGMPSTGDSSAGGKSSNRSLGNEIPRKEKKTNKTKQAEITRSVAKKVEAYIKEHIRPLCKSGVITIEQYRWAVEKTTAKIMRYHSRDTNANFLIKEGEKVKKLAEQYVEASQKKDVPDL